jgi:hypothetical protein
MGTPECPLLRLREASAAGAGSRLEAEHAPVHDYYPDDERDEQECDEGAECEYATPKRDANGSDVNWLRRHEAILNE